jgi:hypothetical protein
MIYDPTDFKDYCEQLKGKVRELKIKKVTARNPLTGKKEEWEEIETASCEFEGREIELFPTGYEHDEGGIRVDNKEVFMNSKGAGLSFELKNFKDVEEVEITANYGGKIKFSKPKKFVLNQDSDIKLVD